MSFYLVLASCTSILYTKSIAVIHADYQVEIKEIICCDRPRTMHQLTAPPGSMGTHNAGALSTQETPCLFAPHPPHRLTIMSMFRIVLALTQQR